MTKIMIADDEALIRKGLLSLIDWAALGCEVVYAASNGMQIVENLDDCKPDIILSDIKMPVMDGLELARYLCEKQIPVKLILLSAFSDFEYARQAIRYGVSDYVTKDGSMEVIEEAVRKCQQTLQKEQETAETDTKRVSALLKSIMDGTMFDREEIFDAAQKYDINIDTFCVMTGELVCSAPISDNQLAQLHHNVGRLIAGEFSDVVHYKLSLGKFKIGIILPISQKTDVKRAALNLCGAISSLTGHALYIGISKPQRDLTALNTAGRQAETALSQRFYDRSRVYFYDGEPSQTAYSTSAIFDAFGEALRTADIEQCEKCLQQLFALQKQNRTPQQMVLSDADVIFSLCKRSLERIGAGLEDIGSSYQQWREVVDEARFFEDCCALQKKLTRDTCRAVDSVLQSGTNIAVDAQNYIEAHYKEPITLKDIAAAVNANPSYLSRYFKQKTGMNIVDTITQKRMEAARRMLSDGKLKIYEISAAIGIEDTTYFSHVFRKYSGMSPKAYQDLEAKNKD